MLLTAMPGREDEAAPQRCALRCSVHRVRYTAGVPSPSCLLPGQYNIMQRLCGEGTGGAGEHVLRLHTHAAKPTYTHYPTNIGNTWR